MFSSPSLSSLAHHKIKHTYNCIAHLAPVGHQIDHTVFEQEFASLKTLWQFLPDRLFDDARARETDQCFRFRHDHVTQHRKARCYAACGWIGEYGNERQSSFVEQ